MSRHACWRRTACKSGWPRWASRRALPPVPRDRDGPRGVEDLTEADGTAILVDALFGTGLSRPVDGAPAHAVAILAAGARLRIAVDVPSGVDTDTGALLGDPPMFDLTLALAAVKPAHVLYPAADRCGEVRIVDIGVPVCGEDLVAHAPRLSPPDSSAHKYSRGMIAVVGGAMPGAAALAAEAAMHAGAGYGLLLADSTPAKAPHALVRQPWSAEALDDPRIDVVVIGPGLGRDEAARSKLEAAIASPHRLVIDGDALHLIEPAHFERFAAREAMVVLTPHAGEFAKLFGAPRGSKIEAARDAAARAGAWVVFKGPDTVIAMPNRLGRRDIRVFSRSSPWLSTAGTGDVLAGTIAAMLPGPGTPIGRIEAGVWLHAEAACRLGGAFIADDLLEALSAARAAL